MSESDGTCFRSHRVSKSVRGAGPAHYAPLFDSELDQASDALDALTESVAEVVYGQNTSTVPDPRSDRALRSRTQTLIDLR
jgi:hypothetical protein